MHRNHHPLFDLHMSVAEGHCPNKGTVLVSIIFCIDMQQVLTLHLEQPAPASSQSSVTQLLSLPNHDNWVLAHHGFVPKTSAILLLGNLLVVCAAEDNSQGGRVLEST